MGKRELGWIIDVYNGISWMSDIDTPDMNPIVISSITSLSKKWGNHIWAILDQIHPSSIVCHSFMSPLNYARCMSLFSHNRMVVFKVWDPISINFPSGVISNNGPGPKGKDTAANHLICDGCFWILCLYTFVTFSKL